MSKEKKPFKVYSAKEVIEISKTQAEVDPHQDIAVVPPPESIIRMPGVKCQHGNYIPATSVSPDHAPYCSLCYPYVIELK